MTHGYGKDKYIDTLLDHWEAESQFFYLIYQVEEVLGQEYQDDL